MKFLPQSYHKIRALIIFAVLLPAAGMVYGQQSASYTQYMDNLTPLNSAYATVGKTASINTLVREQYVGINGAPNTFIFNANLPFESINGAAGFVINNDNFAVEHQLLVNAYFAKAVQVANKSFLSVSLDAGLRSYTANYAGLAPGDPVFRDDVRETKANVGFGVLLYSDKYYLGISVPQLTLRDLGNGSLLSNDYFRNHYYFAGAYLADVADYIKVKPSVLVSYVRGVPTIADISATFYFKQALGVGLTVRTNAEMAAIVSYDISSFHIGYSYEFGTRYVNIDGAGNATHEVTLGFRFGKGTAAPRTGL